MTITNLCTVVFPLLFHFAFPNKNCVFVRVRHKDQSQLGLKIWFLIRCFYFKINKVNTNISLKRCYRGCTVGLGRIRFRTALVTICCLHQTILKNICKRTTFPLCNLHSVRDIGENFSSITLAKPLYGNPTCSACLY